MTRLGAGLAMLFALALAAPANAEDGERTLLVLGEAVGAAPEGMPTRIVIDAKLTAGDDSFKTDIEGWLADIGEGGKGDDIEGACVETRCAIGASLDYNKLAISADLAGPGAPGSGRMVLTDDEGKKLGEAQVRFSAITGPVEDLGTIAPQGAIRSLELADLLTWNGTNTGFSNAGDEEVGNFERSSVADWQSSAGRPGAGLILVEDLELLRKDAAAAQAKAGWTPISGPGWKGGYPAALMPVAQTVGDERRFSSPDGKLKLVIATDPPLDDEAWDAFVDKMTEDQEGVDRHGYTRVNDDMEINWTEKGRYTTAAYHNRHKGLVRLEYSRPDGDEEEGGDGPDLNSILPRSLRVDDND
jgi:hypothetical protein